MISTRWLEQHQGYWQRLEQLLGQEAARGLHSLTRSELQELGLLYRQIASDLAVLVEQPGSARYSEYVNQLLARAHHTIYSTERPGPAAFVGFVTAYPSVVRRNGVACVVSLLLFAASAAIGAGLAYRDPDFKTRILGPAMVETIERHEMWTHSIVAIKPVASSQIMTNNMSVALMAFAAGITAGVGTIYMIVFNGLLLGVVGGACALAGMSVSLWSFVAPHGVLELPAIVLAGGAGLRLAQGIVFPGVRPRRQAIVQGGSEAVKLVLGCLPILVVAGVIEGFVSPTELPTSMKFTMAAALFLLLLTYLFSTSRGALTNDSAA